jgi:hypothetical protein
MRNGKRTIPQTILVSKCNPRRIASKQLLKVYWEGLKWIKNMNRISVIKIKKAMPVKNIHLTSLGKAIFFIEKSNQFLNEYIMQAGLIIQQM